MTAIITLVANLMILSYYGNRIFFNYRSFYVAGHDSQQQVEIKVQ